VADAELVVGRAIIAYQEGLSTFHPLRPSEAMAQLDAGRLRGEWRLL
jgi:hypothetical protein